MPNVELSLKGYDSDLKVIYTKDIKTASDGVGILKMPDNDKIVSLGIAVNTVLNNSMVTGETVYEYDNEYVQVWGETYCLKADTKV